LDGWIKLYRKLLENQIMKKPPLYLKIFVWLLLRAQHTDIGRLKRGQGKTSIPEIIEAMSYKVGYRTEKPTTKEVFGIIDWLRNPDEGYDKGSMMVTTKVTNGFVYTIVKYEHYQDSDTYEGNNVGLTKGKRREELGNNLYNKNVRKKECKKKDIEIYTPLFETAYKNFPRPQAKADTFKNWNSLLTTYTEEQLLQFADNYRSYHESIPESDRPFPYSSNNFYGKKAYYLDFQNPKKWEGKPKTQQGKMPQAGNFNQRQYTDEYFDELYKNV
jgi:hypothetical protein